jgi:hypothetical protein
MLDANLNFPKKESNEYPPLPKGIYQAELLELKAEENETYNSKMGKTNGVKEYQTDLSYQFTLLSGKDKDGTLLRGRNVWENFGASYLYIGKNGKNNLYRIVEAFLGREITREEEATGISAQMLNSFIGKQVQISVEPKKSKDGTKSFDKIIDYFAINALLPALTEEEKEKARVKKDEEKTDGQPTHSAGVPLTPADYMRSGMESTQDNEPTMDDMIKNIPF